MRYRRRARGLAALLAIAGWACGDVPTDPGSAEAGGAPGAPTLQGKPPGTPGGGGGGSPSPIPLTVTVPAGFDVEADAFGGTYMDGDGDVVTQIFGSGNFGLDVRDVKRGKNRDPDRELCLTITERGDPSNVLFQGCRDVNVTTGQPDPDHPNGFFDLDAPGESMDTQMRFLWADEPTGQDEWLRYGTSCFDGSEWPDVASERAIAIADLDGTGWTLSSGEAYWCLGSPFDGPIQPLGPDPDGRVSATVEFHFEPLSP